MPLKNIVLVRLGLDDKEFNARLKAATKKLNKASNEMLREGRRLSIASRELFMGLTLPMGLLGKSVFDATAQMEKMRMGLATIAKSKGIENISELVAGTKELAKLPGLGLTEVFKGVSDLISVGQGGEKALRTIEGLGIGIARAGSSAQEFGRVMIQLTQGLAKGTLQMQDFRTVFEQLKESRGLVEMAFGTADLETLRKMGVTVEQVLDVISTGFRSLGAEGFIDTLANQTENLRDAWLKFRAVIGEGIFLDVMKESVGGLIGFMESLTRGIEAMSPATLEVIKKVTILVGKFALLGPALLFIISRFKILGAMMIKYSALTRTLIKGQALFAGSLGISGRALGGLSLTMLGASKAAMNVGKSLVGIRIGLNALRVAIPILGEVLLVLMAIDAIFPNLKKKLLVFAATLPGINQPLFALASAFVKVKEETVDNTSMLGELDRMLARIEFQNLLDELKKLAGGFNDVESAIDKAIKKLSAISKQRMRNLMGLGSADPIPGQSSQDQAGVLFGQDRGSDFVIPGIESIWEKVREIPEGFLDRLAITDDQLEKFREWGYSFERIAEIVKSGNIAEHFERMNLAAGALGTIASEGFNLLGVAISGAIKNLEGWEKQFTRSVVNMIKKIVSLIAKLGIAAALMSIVFPGSGGLKALSAGTGAFGKGGNLFGKGGFLKSLFGGLGIPGFAEGAIVPSGFPNDSYPALLTSGEKVIPPGKPLPTDMGGPITLRGEFRIRGRDLVYVVEENQVQLR